MIALIRYTCTVLLLSQRYLAPVLLFLGLLAVLTSNDSGPLAPAYASAAAAMLLSSTWLTVTLLALEEPSHRSIVVVSAGSPLRVLLGSVCTVAVWCLPLTAAGLFFPFLTGAHTLTAADVVLGVEAQLTCAFTGIAIGLVCSRLVFRRQGYALVVAVVLVLAVMLVKGLPPVNRLLTLLASSSGSADLVAPTAGLLATAVAVLAAGAALTQVISIRKS